MPDAVWHALSDPTRRRVLDLLRTNPWRTGDLCERFDLSRYAVMKHLTVLEQAGLITFRRDGRERWNYINATPLRAIYERWLTPYQQLWASSLSQLATVVERKADDTVAVDGIRGMKIEHELHLAATPGRVFEGLTRDVGKWFRCPTFGRTQPRPNVVLEPKLGGLFADVSGDHAHAYATVSRVDTGVRLWLVGAMGMRGCVSGWIAFELEPHGSGTWLRLSHHAFGHLDDAAIAACRAGWANLLETNLKPYLEQGRLELDQNVTAR